MYFYKEAEMGVEIMVIGFVCGALGVGLGFAIGMQMHKSIVRRIAPQLEAEKEKLLQSGADNEQKLPVTTKKPELVKKLDRLIDEQKILYLGKIETLVDEVTNQVLDRAGDRVLEFGVSGKFPELNESGALYSFVVDKIKEGFENRGLSAKFYKPFAKRQIIMKIEW